MQQTEHAVVGEAVEHDLALPPRRHEAGLAHRLEVLGGVGRADARALRQRFDAALPLGELLEHRHAIGMARGLRHGGEPREHGLLGGPA